MDQGRVTRAGWGPCPPRDGGGSAAASLPSRTVTAPPPRGAPAPQHRGVLQWGGPWGKPESPAPFGDAAPSKHPALSPFLGHAAGGTPVGPGSQQVLCCPSPCHSPGVTDCPSKSPGMGSGSWIPPSMGPAPGATRGASTLWGWGSAPLGSRRCRVRRGPGARPAGGGSGRGGGPRGQDLSKVTQRQGAPVGLSAGTPVGTHGFTNPARGGRCLGKGERGRERLPGGCRCWGTDPALSCSLIISPMCQTPERLPWRGLALLTPQGPFSPLPSPLTPGSLIYS